MARNTRAEYTARDLRAMEHGFSSYGVERRFKENLRTEINEQKAADQIGRTQEYNPKEVIKIHYQETGYNKAIMHNMYRQLGRSGMTPKEAAKFIGQVMGATPE